MTLDEIYKYVYNTLNRRYFYLVVKIAVIGDDNLINNDLKFCSEIVPIDWSKVNTNILNGELAEGIIYLLNNGTKYIVNDWYEKRGFKSQEWVRLFNARWYKRT